MSAVLIRPVNVSQRRTPLASAGALEVHVACTPDEILQALALRHEVFCTELGARPASSNGFERDVFDPYCHHLVVRDTRTERVVGTYRVLLPERAKLAGCLYADGEFLLTRLNPIRDQLVELGRSCVHADYRTGVVIMLLWSGLGQFLAHHGYRYVIGCASVSMADGGVYAANLYQHLARTRLANETFRVWPRRRLSLEGLVNDDVVQAPPLVKAYLRAGALVLGEPHVDTRFDCADLPMMLQVESADARYRQRFMPKTSGLPL